MTGTQPLPKDTQKLVAAHLSECRNIGLILDKFNPWKQVGDEWDLVFRVQEKRRGQWYSTSKLGGEAKRLWISNENSDYRTKLVDEPILQASHIDDKLLHAYHQRWQKLGQNSRADLFELVTDSRLVVGLGEDSVLETSLALHPLYGFPIIPGSALKGLTRAFALLTLAESLGIPALSPPEMLERKEKKEKTPLNKLEGLLEANLSAVSEKQYLARMLEDLKEDQAISDNAAIRQLDIDQLADHQDARNFRVVFGYPSQTGQVVFFEAVPKEVPRFATDIMNVHYPKYYSSEPGNAAPSDDQQPNPVAFLTVEEGTKFCFAVAPRRQHIQADLQAASLAKDWLVIALCEMGIGGKTTAGYGYFRSKPQQESSPSVEGRIIAVDQNRIVLEMSDGDEATLPISKVVPAIQNKERLRRRFRVGKTIKVWITGRNKKGRLQLTMQEPEGSN